MPTPRVGVPARRAARILLAALACAGAGCGTAPEPARPRLVLLVSLDTFRADLLDEVSADGSPRTPRLLDLAAEAVRFDAVHAPVAFTLPSHMTMLTGLSPEVHGVDAEGRSLAPGIATLAGLLRDDGYRTAAIVSSTWMRAEFGFDRGFDRYDRIQGLATSAHEVTDKALGALAAGDDPRPLFLFVHYFEAHSDFRSQGTRLSYYSPPELRADLAATGDATCDDRGRCATDLLAAADAEGRALPAAEITLHHELYRRGASFLDAELGRLLDGVRAAGLWRDALVVVTADHGEEFREHGRFLHTQAYRECLRVPLLIKRTDDRGGGERDPRLAELGDLLPTLAARLSLPLPPGVDGIDLLDDSSAGHAAIVGRARTGERVYALRTPERLLLRDLDSGTSRLFLLDRDPGETVDRAAQLPDERQRLESLLASELRRLRAAGVSVPGEEGPRFDDAERERLRALGYL